LEESARDCEHIFLLLAFLPYINDTNGNTWGVGIQIYRYLTVQMLQRKVSIGIQTFGHLPGAEISLGFSKEPLGVRWFGGPNYFRSYVNPSLKKQKQGSMCSLSSETWIHPSPFETAVGGA